MGCIGIDKIMNFLPHRYPFLMVDKVIEIEGGKYVKALKNVTINEPQFTGHFPIFPIMPGVLIAEGMAQSAGLMLSEIKESKMKNPIPLLLGIEKMRFKKPVRPGDVMIYEMKLVSERFGMYTVSGRTTVNGETVAEGTLIFGMRDAQKLKEE